MEEKKKSGNILTCLFIILAIAIIGVLVYQNYELKKFLNNPNEIFEKTNTIDSNQNIVNNEQQNTNFVEKSNSNDEVKFLTREEIIDFTEKVNKKMYCRLQLTSIKKDGEKYLAIADYLEQDPLTEEEYKEIVKNGIEVYGYKYDFKNDDIESVGIHNEGYGYLLLDDNSYEKEYDEYGNEIHPWVYAFNIIKTEKGYMLYWGVGGVDVYPLEKVKESVSFYLDADTIVGPSYEGEVRLLKDCVSEFAEGGFGYIIDGHPYDNTISLYNVF